MGGLSPDQTRWVHPPYLFFLPIGVLKRVFRRRFVRALKLAYRQKKLRFYGQIAELEPTKRFAAFLRTAYRKHWVVYAKPALGGPLQVLRYLGRYTHRVAISSHRLSAFDGERVTFRWKDYAHGNKTTEDDLNGHGVCAAFCATYPAPWFCPYSPIWFSGESLPCS